MTVSCAERGFLLARVRDELNLTLLSYQTLYESSLAFGVRKALQARTKRAKLVIRGRTPNGTRKAGFPLS